MKRYSVKSRRWGRGWQAAALMDSYAGDRFIIYRDRSAHGNIGDGKVYRLIDALKHHAQQAVMVNRADEIKP